MWKILKKIITLGFVVGVICVLGLVLILVQEGYPTLSGARNLIFRDGEVRITFPNEMKPLSAECDHAEAVIAGNEVITKIGYSWSVISVKVQTPQGVKTYRFHPKKENSWNRIHYRPSDHVDAVLGFEKFENGVKKSAHDVSESENGE